MTLRERRNLPSTSPRFWRDERGAVAVMVGIAAGALVGVTALAIELGKAWNLQTELQHAADASALAGATQLDGTDGARERARTAAMGGLAQNQQRFASDGQGASVTITAADIRFLVSLGGPVATSDDTANFIEVTAAPRTVAWPFARLVGGPASAETSARAVAGMGTAYCKVPPMFFCAPADPAALTPGNGVWMKGKNNGDSTAWGPGNFGLLALQQFDGSTSLSASLITDAMARVNPIAECFSPDGDVETKPGQTTSIADGINMRFDIYPQGTHQVPPGEPAVRNNPQYRPSANNVKGLWKDGNNCNLASGGASGWKLPPANERFDGPGQHADLAANPIRAMGYPRDNCAYPWSPTNLSGGTCVPASADGVNGRFGDGIWDVATYMAVNHPGMDLLAADLNGDTKVTRYEMHQWEIANSLVGAEQGKIPDNPPNGERGLPVCNTTTGPADALDRRVMTVAVLDCTGLAGAAEVTPTTYYNVFLTEPVGVFGDPPDNKSIYVEIIGPAAEPDFEAKIARYIIQLYE
ncbi:MAG: hypothetical protein KIT20_07170 [Alphaproteobacteria bacterium]|nr:hypothetical protein [Alphaproteobacteria bacterium]